MQNWTLIRTGTVGAVVAALCCFTPLLVVVLPAIGLGAWLAGADYVFFPLLVVSLGVVALGLYRRRASASAGGESETSDRDATTKGLKR
ncbi:MAG: mercury resistance system transport protein MerF [Luteitalea sp.]|nr:mercury resistance system transport protein MerF [Luteitalea sp.]